MKKKLFLCLLLCSCIPRKTLHKYHYIQQTLSTGTEQYTDFELSKIFIAQRIKEYESLIAQNPNYACLISRDSFPREEPNPYHLQGRVVLPQIPTLEEMDRFKDVRSFVFLKKELTVAEITRLEEKRKSVT